ncbi:MAG: hypothetical protein WCR61_05220 [Bacteroidales bacterium]|nr:hypothetical protein [Bacteroidales bacterium]MDD4657361.1 hypothetical protein [Bacteroidales bacterium]
MSEKQNTLVAQLSEISNALKIVEEKRFSSTLSPAQKRELEQASTVLRDRERELLAQIGQEIAQSIKTMGSQLTLLSKKIRAKTKKMSYTTQSLNKVKKALLLVKKLSQSF